MDGMNETEYLADMNRELVASGLKPVRSIAEARRGARQTDNFHAAAETLSRGNGDGLARKLLNLATDAQINFIINLTEQITGIRDSIKDVSREGFTKGEASEMIERLIPVANEAKRERAASRIAMAAHFPEVKAQTIESITDGMYLKDDVVYKVQIAKQGSGRLYAKILTDSGFEYAPGAMRDLRAEHKMTLDQAKEYGKLYGVCCVCSRDLTDEHSIAAGIGPICAKKF